MGRQAGNGREECGNRREREAEGGGGTGTRTGKLMILTQRTRHISRQPHTGLRRFHYAGSCWPANESSPAEWPGKRSHWLIKHSLLVHVVLHTAVAKWQDTQWTCTGKTAAMYSVHCLIHTKVNSVACAWSSLRPGHQSFMNSREPLL